MEEQTDPSRVFIDLPPAFLRAGALLLALVLALPVLAGCGRDEEPYSPTYSAEPADGTVAYVFGPHPLMNPQKLAEVYGALVDLLNRRLASEHIRLKLEASLNYAAFNEKLRGRRLDFALPNPYQTVLAQERGYGIFGKMSRDDDFRGIILVRKDSGIRQMRDLAGATVSFPAPTALAATLMPQLLLAENGLKSGRDYVPLYVGTHDSALLNVCVGTTAAACTWPVAWQAFRQEHPDQARRIEVRWSTATLPSNGLVARTDLPERVRLKVAQALYHVHETPEGRHILDLAGVERFEPADNATFAPVYDFVARYNASVRQLRGLDE